MSDLKTKLESILGNSISKICPNNFHDPSANHCAHFVSHITGLDFSYNCKDFMGGVKQPGNIRVHEVFARCPKVGKFEDAPKGRAVLVFVTKAANVDIKKKVMVNIPQKHIGVFVDDYVYHYSNTKDMVIKQKPNEFFDTYEKIYSGTQGLFFGTIPGSDLQLNVDSSAAYVTTGIGFKLIRKEGGEWFANPVNVDNGQEFFVGREVIDSHNQFFGLFRRVNEYSGPSFKPEDYVEHIDHWSYLLAVTGFCESKNFFTVFNTYDRAKFTYGFYQLAAHTPGDNLILLFRKLIELERAKDYFPELSLINGRLHRVDKDGSSTNLEEEMNTGPKGTPQLQLFMNYLNPLRKTIEEQEVLQVTRLLHWTTNDDTVRHLQVSVANDILQRKMTERYNKWYGLNGKSDLLCAIIADIHHQGRATKSEVNKALQSINPIEKLITINPKQTGRINNLREVIDDLQKNGKLGKKTYDAANNEFV